MAGAREKKVQICECVKTACHGSHSFTEGRRYWFVTEPGYAVFVYHNRERRGWPALFKPAEFYEKFRVIGE